MIQHQSIKVYELQVENGVVSKGRLLLSEEYDNKKYLFKYNDSTLNQFLYKDYIITKAENNLVILAEHKNLYNDVYVDNNKGFNYAKPNSNDTVHEEKFEYSSINLRVEKKYTASNNGEIYYVDEKFFNQKGKLIKRYQFNYNDTSILISLIESFEVEHKQSFDSYKVNTFQYPVWRFEYTFDDHDNWIKRIDYKNGKPVSVAHRKITYE